jgi:hypothetical protein
MRLISFAEPWAKGFLRGVGNALDMLAMPEAVDGEGEAADAGGVRILEESTIVSSCMTASRLRLRATVEQQLQEEQQTSRTGECPGQRIGNLQRLLLTSELHRPLL